MSNKTTLKGQIVALVLGGVLTVLVAEGALRILMPHWPEFFSGRFMRLVTVQDYGLVVTGKPGFEGYFTQNNGDFRAHIAINDFGLRNPDPVEAADGRIWVIGDSMTFGWGVEQNEMYTSVISELLGSPTYNIASPGTDVCGYQALYARMPDLVRPKAVIVGLILENDMAIYDCRARAKDAAALGNNQDTGAPGLMGLKIQLTKRSALYNFMAVSLKRVPMIREVLISIGVIKKEHAYLRYFSEKNIDTVAASAASELARMKAMLPEGTPFAVLVAPGRFELRDGDAPYREMRLRISEELVKRGIGVIDPYEDFKAAGFMPTHFAHDGHWSPLGHRIAGKAVARWLRKQHD